MEMQFLFAPLVGNLSDAFGRRPVMLASLLAMALDYVVMALAGSIWLLLAGRIFGDIFHPRCYTIASAFHNVSFSFDIAHFSF